MARVRLDLGDLPFVLGSLADQQALQQVLVSVAESARAKWARLAQEGLHTTRQAYLLGLGQPFLEGPLRAVVELTGELPNLIEAGADAYSLLEGLLSKPEARRAADGHRWRPVPLRMTGPGTAGRAGQPMDQVYAPPGPESRSTRIGAQHGSRLIGQEVYEAARRLRPGAALPPTGLPPLKSSHAGDPFTGMVRAGGAGHRYYVAFRTASDARPDKWQHPGFAARNFAQAAAQHAARVGPKALRALYRSLVDSSPPTDPDSGG